MVSLLSVFPAIASLDLRRRRSLRMDLFCCFPASVNDYQSDNCNREQKPLNNLSREPKKSGGVHFQPTVHKNLPFTSKSEAKTCQPFLPSNSRFFLKTNRIVDVQNVQDPERQGQKETKFTDRFTLHYFAKKVYAPFIDQKPVKACVLIVFAAASIGCLSGIPQVRNSLKLTDIVPRGTAEHQFLEMQHKYFSFFNMFAITQGNFEYPTNQKLLHEYHQAFTRVGKIIKNDDGGLPDFWLSLFRDWLQNLQQVFEKEWETGCITQDGWSSNATDDGILAYKLLVQTGRVDNPVDKSLVSCRKNASDVLLIAACFPRFRKLNSSTPTASSIQKPSTTI